MNEIPKLKKNRLIFKGTNDEEGEQEMSREILGGLYIFMFRREFDLS